MSAMANGLLHVSQRTSITEDVRDVPTCSLPSLSLQHRLQIAWGAGNELHISQSQEFETSGTGDAYRGGNAVGRDALDGREPGNGIHRVEWGARSPEERHLSYAALPLFCELHCAGGGSSSEDVEDGRWQQVLQWSHKMSALIGPLQNAAPLDSDARAEQAAKLLQRRAMHAVWDLLALCYVDQGAASSPAEPLVNWLLAHDTILTPNEVTVRARLERLFQRLSSTELPEDDPEYWQSLLAAASVGWMPTAIKLLRMHGSYREDQVHFREEENGLVETLAVLLQSMPRLDDARGPALPDGAPSYSSHPHFSHERAKWLGKLAKLETLGVWAQCRHPASVQGLQQLLRLLQGSRELMGRAARHWLELLASRLLHLQPRVVGGQGLGALARQCRADLGRTGGEEPRLEKLLLAVLERNTEEVVLLCSRSFDSWFMAHMTELLLVGGLHEEEVLGKPRKSMGGLSLQELYRLQYVRDLASHPATWQVAPAYAAMCPRQGQAVLEEVLLRQALVGTAQAPYKALEVCREYGLTAVATSISRAVGLQCWERGERSRGLAWLLRAGDVRRLREIASLALASLPSFVEGKARGGRGGEEEAADGPLSMEELGAVLEELGPQLTAAHNPLAFLHSYRTLRTLVARIQRLRRGPSPSPSPSLAARGAQREVLQQLGRHASEILMELMEDASLPPGLLVLLLDTALPLLDWPEGALIGYKETQLLMSRLHDHCLGFRSPLPQASSGVEHPTTRTAEDPNAMKLQQFRLALATNYGRAITSGA